MYNSDNKMTSIEVFPPMPVNSISFRNNKILQIADRFVIHCMPDFWTRFLKVKLETMGQFQVLSKLDVLHISRPEREPPGGGRAHRGGLLRQIPRQQGMG